MSVRSYLSLISMITVVSGVAVIVSVLASNPLRMGPIGVTLWFVALLGFLQGAFSLVLLRQKKRLFPALGEHKAATSSWRQGFLVGGAITMLVALSSLRQLGLRDIILLTGLLILVEFYYRARA